MHLRILCTLLVAVALATFGYRALVLGYPVLPDQDSAIWALEAQIDVEPTGEAAGEDAGARLGLFLPPDNARYGRLREDFVSSRLALTTQTDALGNRAAVWSTGALDGRSSVIYRALFVGLQTSRPVEALTTPPEDLPEDLRRPPERSAGVTQSARDLAARTARDSADLPTQVALMIERLNSGVDGGSLFEGEPGPRKVAEAAAFALAQQDDFARPVHGILLRGRERGVTPTAWLEVWTGEEWQAFDTATGDPFEALDRLVWWRGYNDLVQVEGADIERQSFALAEQRVGAVAAAGDRAGLLDDPVASLSLLSLSVNTQLVFETLMMVPVGALLLVVMRQVVGVETIGTFMPVLIALAFQVTDLIYGVLFFTGLVATGLLVRFWFAQLNLLLVPRLAAMLVVVILIMIGMSLVADAVSLGLGLSVALFPIVILTMTIERMSVTWEENGPSEAITQGVGSMVVAVLAYLVMNIEVLRHLVVVFPELLLIVLAAMLLLGRYSGYRLSELYRFRDLARES